MSNHAGKAFGVADMTDVLLDCWFRLLSLSSHPHDIPVLAPLYEKELLYLTLQGPLGAALRDIAMQGSALKRVHLAVEWLRLHFKESISIKQLAEISGMSESSFHRKFKIVTLLSPIQYQKQT